VGGREKVSLSLMCVIAPIELPIGLMVAFYRSYCVGSVTGANYTYIQ